MELDAERLNFVVIRVMLNLFQHLMILKNNSQGSIRCEVLNQVTLDKFPVICAFTIPSGFPLLRMTVAIMKSRERSRARLYCFGDTRHVELVET